MHEDSEFRLEKIDEVITRYPQLHPAVRSALTDFYNYFIGLQQIAYGQDWQQENATSLVNDKLGRGEKAFTTFENYFGTRDKIQEGLTKKEEGFSQSDIQHLDQLDALLNFVNQEAQVGQLNEDVARQVYDLLIPYLYGRPSSESVKRAGKKN